MINVTIVNGSVGRGAGALPFCRNQPESEWRVCGGAAAADSISPGPKGAARTEGPLLRLSKKGFHFHCNCGVNS